MLFKIIIFAFKKNTKKEMPKKRSKNTLSHPLYRNATLTKRGEVIYFCILHDGKRLRFSSNLTWDKDNFKLAMRLLEKKYLELINPDITIDKAESLTDLFNMFINYKAKSISAVSIKKYKQAWNNWIIRDYNTNEIDVLKKDIMQRIYTSDLHPNTINKSLDLLSAFFSHLIELGNIIESPIVKSFKQKVRQVENEMFEQNEIEMILRNFGENTEMWYLIKFISLTGMRISEVIGLNKNDFHATHISFIGKGAKQRDIPLIENSELWKICDVLKMKPKPFSWQSATKPHKHLRNICKKLKIKNKGYHGIRRYFENTMIEAGANIKSTADILGHTLAIQEKHYKTKSKIGKLKEAISLVTKY